MGAYADLNAEIKTIIEATGATYVRATPEEANVRIQKIDASSPIGFHVTIPAVEDIVVPVSTYTVHQIPVEIWFLQKDNSQDELLTDSDIIIDQMFDLANQAYDRMVYSDELDPITPFGAATISVVDAFRILDTILVGVAMSVLFPIKRKNYTACP